MKRQMKYMAVAVTTLGAVVAFSTPATAVPPGGPSEPGSLLQLRKLPTDPWSDNLNAPLFGLGDSPIVPGDPLTEKFWAFNTTGAKAYLSLSCSIGAVRPASTPDAAVTDYDDLADALSLDYRVNNASSVQAVESCETGSSRYEIPGRTASEVEVHLSFSPTEANPAMNLEASYSITVTLSQIPPKGGKPRVLGAQTLVSSPDSTTGGDVAAGGSNGTSTGNGTSPAQDAGGSSTGKGNGAPTKTTSASALLSGEPGVVTESMPLITGLLAGGALLAGLRRRRHEGE